jgi:S1-C subfamily serine protease
VPLPVAVFSSPESFEERFKTGQIGSTLKFQEEIHAARITGLSGADCKTQPKPGGIPVLVPEGRVVGCHYVYPDSSRSSGQSGKSVLDKSPHELDLPEAYRQSLKETVFIALQEKGNDAYSGSGVVVAQTDSKTYILTVDHVANDEKEKVTGLRVETNDGEWYPARLLKHDAKKELALLEIYAGKNSKHPLQVASVVKDGDGPKPNDRIVFAGYPEDTRSLYMSPGRAGKMEHVLFDHKLWLNVLALRARGSHGNSGGPVFNSKHELFGLIEGGTPLQHARGRASADQDHCKLRIG